MKDSKIKFMQTLVLCIVLSLVCEGCSAQRKPSKWLSYSPVEVDSTLSASFGDSIINIINSATKIEVAQLEIKNDSLKFVSGGRLKKQDKSLLTFLVMDEEMARKAPINIYAKFCPMIQVDFKTKDSRCATFYFDFGLSQWRLENASDKTQARGVIPSRQLLKFFHSVFPKNETLKAIYNFKPENK